MRALDTSTPSVSARKLSGDGPGGTRGQVSVQFFEKRRRKSYFFSKADEDVCWEMWMLDVTMSVPKSESGMSLRALWRGGVRESTSE